jgi:hypothetical protein
MLQIAIIKESTGYTDAQVQNIISAFTQQWNSDLKPVCGDLTWLHEAAALTQGPSPYPPLSL